MTRDQCITDPALLAVLITCNALIAIAYFWIPISIARIAARVDSLPVAWLWGLTGAFIGGCAFTHLAAVLVFFYPAWYLEAVACAATAAVSIVTAALLSRSVPKISETINDARKLAERVAAGAG